MKAKIVAVAPTGAKFGEAKDRDIFMVVTDPPAPNGVYKSFHQNLGSKIGQEIEFTVEEKEYQGRKEYILHMAKGAGGGGKSAWTPKGPTELEVIQRHSAMMMSYAKDLAQTYIQNGSFPAPSEPGELIRFSQTMYEEFMKITGKAIKPYLKGPQATVPLAPPVAPPRQAPKEPEGPLPTEQEDDIPF